MGKEKIEKVKRINRSAAANQIVAEVGREGEFVGVGHEGRCAIRRARGQN